MTSEAITRGVRVAVKSRFLPEQSQPAAGSWVFAYSVEIANGGEEAVQLVSRHWIITNSRGEVEHVRGPGVVGEQPVIRPGEAFRYNSGCPLDTDVGTMHGSYQMVTAEGERFDAEIAPFMLAEPYAVN